MPRPKQRFACSILCPKRPAEALNRISGLLLLTVFLSSSMACAEQPQDAVGSEPVPASAEPAAAEYGSPEPATDAVAEQPTLKPDVNPALAFEVIDGVTVIPDPRIAFVPNIGIIEGTEAVLVVDTGLGAENGRRVLDHAREIAGERSLYLTTTHFHPEHNFGASVFETEAEVIMNSSQAEELREKGQPYVELFKTFGPDVAERLEGTTLVTPDRLYDGETTLDLGGRKVVLREIPAHTRGDQLIYLPAGKLMFTGDMAEPRYFPIMPDADSSADRWIAELRGLEAMAPEIVVPGHGAVGGREILSKARLHIEFVRDRVRAFVADGKGQQAITDLLVPAITALYSDWGNQEFLPFEIAIIHAETTGTEPELPSF